LRSHLVAGGRCLARFLCLRRHHLAFAKRATNHIHTILHAPQWLEALALARAGAKLLADHLPLVRFRGAAGHDAIDQRADALLAVIGRHGARERAVGADDERSGVIGERHASTSDSALFATIVRGIDAARHSVGEGRAARGYTLAARAVALLRAVTRTALRGGRQGLAVDAARRRHSTCSSRGELALRGAARVALRARIALLALLNDMIAAHSAAIGAIAALSRHAIVAAVEAVGAGNSCGEVVADGAACAGVEAVLARVVRIAGRQAAITVVHQTAQTELVGGVEVVTDLVGYCDPQGAHDVGPAGAVVVAAGGARPGEADDAWWREAVGDQVHCCVVTRVRSLAPGGEGVEQRLCGGACAIRHALADVVPGMNARSLHDGEVAD